MYYFFVVFRVVVGSVFVEYYSQKIFVYNFCSNRNYDCCVF